MQALHIVLLATTALAFTVAAAPGSRVGSGSEHGRLIALVVSGAAVVGNAASLMPGTPVWYARAMIVITFAAVVSALAGLVTQRRGGADDVVVVRRTVRRPPVIRQAQAPRVSGSALRPPLYAVPDADIVDAQVVEDDGTAEHDSPAEAEGSAEDDGPAGSVSEAGPPLRLATQETFAAAGPRQSGSTRGQAYVAANLRDYLPEDRQHLLRRRPRATQVGEANLRARLTRAYGLQTDARGDLASHQA